MLMEQGMPPGPTMAKRANKSLARFSLLDNMTHNLASSMASIPFITKSIGKSLVKSLPPPRHHVQKVLDIIFQ